MVFIKTYEFFLLYFSSYSKNKKKSLYYPKFLKIK